VLHCVIVNRPMWWHSGAANLLTQAAVLFVANFQYYGNDVNIHPFCCIITQTQSD